MGRHTRATRALRAYMATALIALFIQHPLLDEQQPAMLSCLWDRACVALGAKIDFAFGRLADDVYEVIVALTDVEGGDGDEEVAEFLKAGQDLNVERLVAKIEKELMAPGGGAEGDAARPKKTSAPKTGPDARGVEAMVYRGQMLERMAARSAGAQPSQNPKEDKREEAPRRGIWARSFSKNK
ncbi:hypothetical protein PG994_002996 [Apiospora phragmitis]|uniref:Uncharacterized protein n=1 Tax=Apiospora phragmitis TaxID=2905665 RepID=A0ABR1WAJ3_9PEZI